MSHWICDSVKPSILQNFKCLKGVFSSCSNLNQITNPCYLPGFLGRLSFFFLFPLLLFSENLIIKQLDSRQNSKWHVDSNEVRSSHIQPVDSSQRSYVVLNYLHVFLICVLARMNEELSIMEIFNRRDDGQIHSGESYSLTKRCQLPLLNNILFQISSSESCLLGCRICAGKGFWFRFDSAT